MMRQKNARIFPCVFSCFLNSLQKTDIFGKLSLKHFLIFGAPLWWQAHAQSGYPFRSNKIVCAADINGICLAIAINIDIIGYHSHISSVYCIKYLRYELKCQARCSKAPRRMSGRWKRNGGATRGKGNTSKRVPSPPRESFFEKMV